MASHPPKGRAVVSPGPTQRQGQTAQSPGRGAYHLAPLSSALATVAAPQSQAQTQTVSAPLVLSPVPPAPEKKVSSHAVTRWAQMWPAMASSRQRRRQAALESKAPLALQLEAFIRREHQQYLREHPSCSRADCLHIFREVFNTFSNHFSEYRGILALIRDEYDAALNEMSEKVKQMQVDYLESQTDRELHAMELIQLKESMNSTISNQKAQLSAAQELLHAMRDQVSAAEHANALLTLEMEAKRKTYMEAQQQVKLLSHVMIEESARTAAVLEQQRNMEKESRLQEARIKVLKEQVEELEGFLRLQTYAQIENHQLSTGTDVLPAGLRGLLLQTKSLHEGDDAMAGGYPRHFVTQLLARIDALEMKLAQATKKDKPAHTKTFTLPDSVRHPTTSQPHLTARDPVASASPAASNSADAVFRVIRGWLQQEGVGEAEVESTDVIVPPGRIPSEVMGFLSATVPIKHRHLSLEVTLQLLELMWKAREQNLTSSRLQQFFLEWLQTRAGDPGEVKALGVNLLDTCQHNIHHPDCRALLAVLKGYLPEEMVHMCRRRLAQLRRSTAISAATLHEKMSFDAFFAEVRAVCPEKSLANMLHLRFTVFRSRTEAGEVDLARVLSDGAYFVTLFKLQWVQEVDAFTLRVVEGIREEGDVKRNCVPISKATRVLQQLDTALGGEVFKYVSLASQRPVIDVTNAEEDTVPLDTLLCRFRTSVLLYRRSPEDIFSA
ncbi:hypothetical protein JKF63_03196 [Porcisia hertigi]|uniref:Translin-associated factor X-interacting protein 1 N-terminal domain-containing protein n=1 Tax=Porcisia hertigi TaxID=2761500 RepID=A0A836I1S8_9TRYP|nr:hypothetical protein JKF63_03196 [Porcisia hertigi]